MYQRGNRYTGEYTNWCIPETFSGFELDTESDTPRDWDAMQRERTAYAERSTLLSPEKRTRVAGSSSSEEEGSSLPKMSRTERSNLTLRQFTPPDIVDETPSYSSVTSPLEEEEFNYEGLDRESSNIEDDVVTRNAANMDTARALIFIPQPSTSREEEQPSTSRQADVRAVDTNDITLYSGSTTEGIGQASFAVDTAGVSSGSSTGDIRQASFAVDTAGVSSGSPTGDIRQASFAVDTAGVSSGSPTGDIRQASFAVDTAGVSSGSSTGDIRQASFAVDTAGVSSGSSTGDIRQASFAVDTAGVSSGSSTGDIRQASFAVDNAGVSSGSSTGDIRQASFAGYCWRFFWFSYRRHRTSIFCNGYCWRFF
ncbi:hypothetical protein C0Q70_18631 [Pomacea canaliculata]|uniref:Uncharacterized protein n=1 Tax=Pomacea canaliculata TaxID=400727 RepID=A0A2T7NH48_POMCA|nr:hypothetical protein C0Q70_18631 [Pomacea canaliculata]